MSAILVPATPLFRNEPNLTQGVIEMEKKIIHTVLEKNNTISSLVMILQRNIPICNLANLYVLEKNFESPSLNVLSSCLIANFNLKKISQEISPMLLIRK